MKPFWGCLGVCLCLAGFILGAVAFTDAKKQIGVGEQILEQFRVDESTGLRELLTASLDARAAFFGRAMSADAERLRLNEQGLSVALSRVSDSAAGALFRRVILPALTTSQNAKALLEGDAFLRRWSIADTMSAGDRDALASKLVERMYTEDDRDTLTALATLLSRIEKSVGQSTADKLSKRLIARLAHDHDLRTREALIAGLAALGQSQGVIEFLLHEDDPHGLRILARDAPDFEKNLSPEKADELARKLTARLAVDLNPLAIDALVAMLIPLHESVTSREAAEVATQLVERAYAEFNAATVQTLLSGLNVFAKRLDDTAAKPLAARLATRLDIEPSAETLAVFASGLAGLAEKADKDTMETTAAHIAIRIAREPYVSNLEFLAEALNAFKEKARERNIVLAVTTLGNRLVREQNLNALVTLSSAIEKLDGEAPRPESESLATEIVGRVAIEGNHSAILPLTMAIDALDENIRAAKAEELASKLLARMRVDHDPEVLRALAVGLRFLKEKISPRNFDEAATILVTAMQTSQGGEALQTLAFGLHSCLTATGAETFDRAAAIPIAHMAQDPQPNLEGFLAIQSRVSNARIEQAASVLVDLMTQQSDATKVHSLALDLEAIEDRVAAPAANRMASRLGQRMAAERDPELLRALGSALGGLPADSISTAQIGYVFMIAGAPCQIVLRVPAAERLRAVANGLLNPFCSEPAWISLASALGEMTHQPIVRGTAKREALDLDFDGMGMLKDDDDDEGKSKPGETAEFEPLRVNFDLLSKVLDNIRLRDPLLSRQTWMELSSALLLILGLLSAGYGRFRDPARSISTPPE